VSSRSVRAVLAAALMTVLLPTAPSWAAESPGEHIANALHDSPVYVADAYADAVPPSRQRQLTQQIAATGLPIKVVLTPLTKGDAFDGEAKTLASVVHDRLGLRKFILITTDGDFTDSLNGYEWPSDTHRTRDAVAAAGFLHEMRDAGLADLTSKAVELVAEGDGTRVHEEAVQHLGDAAAASPTSNPSPGKETGGLRGRGYGSRTGRHRLGHGRRVPRSPAVQAGEGVVNDRGSRAPLR